jgi:hypothetical protein
MADLSISGPPAAPPPDDGHPQTPSRGKRRVAPSRRPTPPAAAPPADGAPAAVGDTRLDRLV